MSNYIKILAGVIILFVPFPSFSQNSSSIDSTISVAANASLKGSGIGRLFVGKNYRREWTQPVKAPVLKLQQLGLTPEKEGGGKETKSLHVKNDSGGAWALRSVRKFPEKVIPDIIKHTLGEKIVEADISASYPYGALSMPVLSKAAGVPYLSDVLVYLPDDTALGKFREKYKETLVLMEEKEPLEFLNHPDKKPESISTDELVQKLQDKKKNRVNQLSVLRVRLLDNFVMDFDRHEGQWNWLKKDTLNADIYSPVPKDRDQVFYINQGIIPKIVASKSLFPELMGFRAKVKSIGYFNRAAQNFDRYFLTELNEEDWNRETDALLRKMTDEVIDSALAKQPKEVQQFSVAKITSTLKRKRQYFKADMMRYYRAVSKTVSVTGTNEDENFTIKIKDDQSVEVTVKDSSSSGILYHRTFVPSVTNEIRLYGLEGNDHFEIEGGDSPIKIRMIGGPGKDEFINQSGSNHILVYDVKFEENKVQGPVRNKINNDPLNNQFNRLDFNYNVSGTGPSIEISPYEGFFLGLAYKGVKRGFHREPFASKQFFSVTHAWNSSSIHFRYNADIMQIFPHTDLLIRGGEMNTNKTNFFGPGNTTLYSHPKFKQGYYHMKYNLAELEVLAKTKFGNYMSIQYGPTFEYLQMKQKENSGKLVSTIYSYPNSDVYQKKIYAGGTLSFTVDTRNGEMLTTQGILLNAYVRTLAGMNDHSSHYSQTGGSFAWFADLGTKGTLVLANISGADHNIGKFEPAQSQFLGFTEHLRGFVSHRFAGRTVAYNQSEIRIRVGNINTLLIRTDFGLYGFNDTGRVWADGEKSNIWHDGYGGGIWLAPTKKFVVTGYLSFSKEVKALPWITLGFVF